MNGSPVICGEVSGDAFKLAARKVPLFAENPARRAVLVQNRSLTADLFLSFTGVPGVQHLRIAPGQAYSSERNCPANSIWIGALSECPFYAYEG